MTQDAHAGHGDCSEVLHRIYEYLDGWNSDISGCRSFDELPKNAQVYVQALEEMSGAKIWGVGVGPGREQTVVVHG